MIDLLISILIPVLLIIYLLRINWDGIMESRFIQIILAAGVVAYFTGVYLNTSANAQMGALLKLGGAILLLSIAALQAIKYRKQKKSDQADATTETRKSSKQ